MNRREKTITGILCSIAVLVIAALLVILISHIRFRKAFVLQDNLAAEQYEKKIPLHEMDLDCFSPYVTMDVPAVDQKVNFQLPEDIVYYREVNGKKEQALVLKKGTVVAYQESFRGAVSFPTYEKGWRYAVPFLPEEYAAGGTVPAAYEEHYYVKLSSLEKAARAWQRAGGMQYERNARKAVYRITRYIDARLYEKGIYLSPDLSPLKQRFLK